MGTPKEIGNILPANVKAAVFLGGLLVSFLGVCVYRTLKLVYTCNKNQVRTSLWE